MTFPKPMTSFPNIKIRKKESCLKNPGGFFPGFPLSSLLIPCHGNETGKTEEKR
jgi:hypothetical protein